MTRKPECVELQSRMVEFFSDQSDQVPPEIEKHLATCPECQLEFAQLRQVLHELRENATLSETVPEHLLSAVESRLDATEQVKPADRKSTKARNVLILQYSYLASLTVIIWLTLLHAQPMLNSWLTANNLLSALPVVDEYGLFLAFFAAGGIFALISSPLIIKTSTTRPDAGKRGGFFTRLFSGGLRIFAC